MKKQFRTLATALALCFGMLCPAAAAAEMPGETAKETASVSAAAEAGNPDFTGEYRPVVTAHRGSSKAAPENTLPAFQLAIDQGCPRAELDVQMTMDGVVVVSHDASLRRCTGWDKNIDQITFEQLRRLDAGWRFCPLYIGTKVPTLAEVLDLCKDKIQLNIEIKANAATPDLEAQTVRLIYDKGFENSCVVTSGSYETLCKVKALAPQIRTGYILYSTVDDAYYDLPAADFFSIDQNFITPEVVQQAHQRGKTVSAWTVDSRAAAANMLRLGVDDIITDKPDMVLRLLAQQKLSTKN